MKEMNKSREVRLKKKDFGNGMGCARGRYIRRGQGEEDNFKFHILEAGGRARVRQKN